MKAATQQIKISGAKKLEHRTKSKTDVVKKE